MDYKDSIKKINEKKIIRTVEALKKNNMDARYFQNREDLLKAIKEMIPEGSTTALGGSYTTKQIDGLIDLIKSYDFKDRKKKAKTEEEAKKIKMEANFVDYYFMSSNAITSDGKLYNVDGTGNRVSALIYGPENVVIIAGPNKIVSSIDAAIDRVKEESAPMNCERLDMDTPCRKLGSCANCRSDERICIFYTVTGYQRNKNRIKVFFLNDDTLGL